jgi:hypothetical protein
MARMYVGERRTLRFRVDNIEGEEFVIKKAHYLTSLDGGVVSSGTMEIVGNELSFLFSPNLPGIYTIEIHYQIGFDEIIGRFVIEVAE